MEKKKDFLLQKLLKEIELPIYVQLGLYKDPTTEQEREAWLQKFIEGMDIYGQIFMEISQMPGRTEEGVVIDLPIIIAVLEKMLKYLWSEYTEAVGELGVSMLKKLIESIGVQITEIDEELLQ
jgi:hypothetical protein